MILFAQVAKIKILETNPYFRQYKSHSQLFLADISNKFELV